MLKFYNNSYDSSSLHLSILYCCSIDIGNVLWPLFWELINLLLSDNKLLWVTLAANKLLFDFKNVVASIRKRYFFAYHHGKYIIHSYNA